MGTQNSIEQKPAINKLYEEFEQKHPKELVALADEYANADSYSDCILAKNRHSRICADNCRAWLERYLFHDSARFAAFIVHPLNPCQVSRDTSGQDKLDEQNKKSELTFDQTVEGQIVFVPIVEVFWFFARSDKILLEVMRDLNYEDMYQVYQFSRDQKQKRSNRRLLELIDIERSDTNAFLQRACKILTRKDSSVAKQYYLQSRPFSQAQRTFIGLVNANLQPIPYLADQYQYAYDDGFRISIRYSALDSSPNPNNQNDHVSDRSFLNIIKTFPQMPYTPKFKWENYRGV